MTIHRPVARRRIPTFLLCASVALGASAASFAQTSAYPNKPVRWIVPWGPGSSTDILSRVVASELPNYLKTAVIVENKSGADGNIGASYVAASKPDGYTLMMGTASTNAVNVTLNKELKYDPQRDFRAVAMIGDIPNVLVVGPKLGATSVKDLIKSSKGKVRSFASTGVGGTVHLSGELFKSMTKLEMTHIPYRDGSTLMSDLLTGRVDMMFCNLPLCLKQIEAGSLIPLGVTSAKRSPVLPNVPTIAEQGLEGFDVVGWYGVFVPKTVPDSVVLTLSQAFNQTLTSSKVRDVLASMGVTSRNQTAPQVDAFTASERVRWAKLISDQNIQ